MTELMDRKAIRKQAEVLRQWRGNESRIILSNQDTIDELCAIRNCFEREDIQYKALSIAIETLRRKEIK